MSIISMIFIGFVVGLLARAIMPGRDKVGVFITIMLGILGSFVGGFVGRLIGMYQAGEPAGLIMSILGALLLLFAFRKTVKA